jgi:hypothetical protein
VDKTDLKNLKKRYLIWLYKTTKDALDRIERKFTQLEIDLELLKEIKSQYKDKKAGKFIDEFSAYIKNKGKEGRELKFEGKIPKPEYSFLAIKLRAIEKVTLKEFGNSGLSEIKSLYEKEMIKRILSSTEHK